ncbi:DNA-binding LacI/PurR family transcriptional regulator [Rhodococcus sp. SORGH_AS303]|nr:DNA-binding LacI/PurR family transcriptional regulator [Rhodococcus sp. SORGH_AS_0303]
MTDVAKLAGVSHQTVSRVINGHPHVTDATRARVTQAITQLGYRPNTAARALVTGSNRTIGIVATGVALHGPVSTLYSVERAARHAGYSVLVGVPTSLEEDAINACVRSLHKQGVDGVVVVAPLRTDNGDIAGLAGELPLVAVEGSPAGDLAVVSVDQVLGARDATSHLLELGHREVWHVAGPLGWYEAADRVSGWRSVQEERGIDPPPMMNGDWTARSGYAAGTVLAQIKGVTAVFAGKRLHGARSAARARRPRAAGSRGHQPGRFRRCSGRRVLLTSAHHDPPGVQRGGRAERRDPARADRVREVEHPTLQHRPQPGHPSEHGCAGQLRCRSRRA